MDIIDKLNAIIIKKSKEVKNDTSQIYNETILEVIKEAMYEIKKLRNEKNIDHFIKKFTKVV